MYLLYPNIMRNESFMAKYELFTKNNISMCKANKSDMICPSELYYSMCLSQIDSNISSTILHCPAYNIMLDVQCNLSDGSWSNSLHELFQACQIKNYLLRATIYRNFILILGTINLLLFITSIFKLGEFSEISDEFQWKMFIYMLLVASIKHFTLISIVAINVPYTLYHLCTFLTITIIYEEYFVLFSIQAVCLYIYYILYDINTQMRILRAALTRFALVCPVLCLVVEVIIDTSVGDKLTFSCKDDPILSSVFSYQYLMTVIIFFTIVYIKLKIAYLLKCLNFEENPHDIYRVEYDILGDREELSYQDITRLLFVLDTCMQMMAMQSLLCSLMWWFRLAGVESVYYTVAVVLYSAREIVVGTLMLQLVWHNRFLENLIVTYRLWYFDIDLNTVGRCTYEELNVAVQVGSVMSHESHEELDMPDKSTVIARPERYLK